jgi:hypothetical protein
MSKQVRSKGAKTETAHDKSKTSKKEDRPTHISGPSGRRYKSMRGGRLDGFLNVGNRDEPLMGTLEGRLVAFVEKDSGKVDKKTREPIINRFYVFEVENVEGDLELSTVDEDGEQSSSAPDNWPGLRVGVSYAAALDHLGDKKFLGQMFCIEYRGARVNPKSGFQFREIDCYEVDDESNGISSEARA